MSLSKGKTGIIPSAWLPTPSGPRAAAGSAVSLVGEMEPDNKTGSPTTPTHPNAPNSSHSFSSPLSSKDSE